MGSPSLVVIEVENLPDAEFALLNEKALISAQAKRKQFWSFIFFLLSSLLFFLAMIPGILFACFPVVLMQHIGSLVEYGLRLLGYSSWGGYAFTRFDEYETLTLGGEHSLPKNTEVASLRHEKYAAWIGVFACVAIIVSLTCPPAAIVALLVGFWGFAVSNAIWSQGCQKNVELGSKKYYASGNYPADYETLLQLEYEQARAYRNYAIAATVLSLVVAMTATVIVLFPPSIALMGLIIVAGISLKGAVTASIATTAIGLLGYSFYKRKKMEDAKKLIGNDSAQIDSEATKPKLLLIK
ncbi:MAG: hypothetical protein A3F10_00850 [Coxiella sp. RIFCSPHIGHO2_12_FULL_42_15]|nr:MAG: hypothetical protein A3F10_00850 [Coxiella sp. RIFCSPHIGHO2_12_FULL_42_15]